MNNCRKRSNVYQSTLSLTNSKFCDWMSNCSSCRRSCLVILRGNSSIILLMFLSSSWIAFSRRCLWTLFSLMFLWMIPISLRSVWMDSSLVCSGFLEGFSCCHLETSSWRRSISKWSMIFVSSNSVIAVGERERDKTKSETEGAESTNTYRWVISWVVSCPRTVPSIGFESLENAVVLLANRRGFHDEWYSRILYWDMKREQGNKRSQQYKQILSVGEWKLDRGIYEIEKEINTVCFGSHLLLQFKYFQSIKGIFSIINHSSL